MIRKLATVLGFLLIGPMLLAQTYATVIGTVTDPGGNPLAFAQLTATLVDANGVPQKFVYLANNTRIITAPVQATLSSAGAFSVSLLENSVVVTPAGSQWQLNISAPAQPGIILDYAPAWTITYTASITANVDFSSQLTALAQTIVFMNLQTGQNTLISSAGSVAGPASSTNNDLALFNGTTGKIIKDGGTFLSNIPAQYKTWSCQPGLGDGTNAIAAATYPQTGCRNETGVTVILTGIRCFTDNSGTTTLAVSDSASNNLLTGPITCTTAWAAGTQSVHVTLAANAWLVWSLVADGTTKQATFDAHGTY